MGAVGVDSRSLKARSSTNPRKGAQPVPGPMRMSGSEGLGAGREPL